MRIDICPDCQMNLLNGSHHEGDQKFHDQKVEEKMKQAMKEYFSKPTPTPAVKSQGPREWKVLEAYDDLKRPIENGVDDCYYRLRGPEMSDEDINTTLIEKSAYEAMERELADLNKRYSTWHSDFDYKAADRRITLQCQVIEQLETQITELQEQLAEAEKTILLNLKAAVNIEKEKDKRIRQLEDALKELLGSRSCDDKECNCTQAKANKTLKGARND